MEIYGTMYAGLKTRIGALKKAAVPKQFQLLVKYTECTFVYWILVQSQCSNNNRHHSLVQMDSNFAAYILK